MNILINWYKKKKKNSSKLVGWTDEQGNDEDSSVNIKYKKQDYGYDSLSASFEERMFNDKSPLMSRRISNTSKPSESSEETKENAKPQKEQNAKKQQQKQNFNPEKKSQKQMTRAERRALQVNFKFYN